MLVPVVVSLGLFLVGAVVVAKVTHLTARRLGLDFFRVLEWFGLAETVHPAPPVRLVATRATRRSAAAPGT